MTTDTRTLDGIALAQLARRVALELLELQDAMLETYATGGLANVTSAPSVAAVIGPAVAVEIAATSARLRLFADQVQWQYDSRQLAEPIR